MHIFYAPELPESNTLSKEESNHCVKVLRKGKGDEILLIDGRGTFYTVEITDANPKKCNFKIKSTKKDIKPDYHRHIAIAPTKNTDRIEWFVEKAVEFGIDEITFFTSFHSERSKIKAERIHRKVLSAAKQSMKAYIPTINLMRKFEEVVADHKNYPVKCIAYVDFDNPLHFQNALKQQDTLIMIGPEGDFSEQEISLATKNDFKKVSLGSSRLRTETAGIAAAQLMNL